MNDNDKIYTFREECRRYLDFQEHIDNINNRLRELKIRMEDVHSPSFVKIGSTPSRYEKDMVTMIEQKTRLEHRKAYYQKRMMWIKETIDLIPSPAYRALVWMTYVRRDSVETISKIYDIKADHLNKVRRKFLLYVLTNEKMQELDYLQQQEMNYRYLWM